MSSFAAFFFARPCSDPHRLRSGMRLDRRAPQYGGTRRERDPDFDVGAHAQPLWTRLRRRRKGACAESDDVPGWEGSHDGVDGARGEGARDEVGDWGDCVEGIACVRVCRGRRKMSAIPYTSGAGQRCERRSSERCSQQGARPLAHSFLPCSLDSLARANTSQGLYNRTWCASTRLARKQERPKGRGV